MENKVKFFKETLRSFPSLFEIEVDVRTDQVSDLFLHQVLERVEKETNEYPCDTARIRNLNLRVFLLAIVGKTSNATKLSENAIEIDPFNIIALTNTAWISIKREENYSEVYKACASLKKSEDDKKKFVVARAEIAHAYSRLGARFENKTTEIYSEVLQADIKEDAVYWNENICLWKFGKALTDHRKLSIRNHSTTYAGDLCFSRENWQSVFRQFKDIVQLQTETETTKLCKARSLVLLGELIVKANFDKDNFPNGARDITTGEFLSPEKYADEALQIYPGDSFVRVNCGKIFKLCHMIDKALANFRKAIEIKETSQAHHYLALCLKIQLEMQQGYGHARSRRHESSTTFSKEKKQKHFVKNPPLVYRPLKEADVREEIEEIIRHLDKAFDLSPNYSAKFDKGLLYRQLDRISDALDTFKEIFQSNDNCCSALDITIAYQQAAICITELIKRCDNSAQTVKLMFDAVCYNSQATEFSKKVVSEMPSLKNCFEHVHFTDKLQNINTIISTWNNCLPERNFEEMSKLIAYYIDKKDFEDAMMACDVLRSLSEGINLLDETQYVSLCIGGAIEALKHGEHVAARKRLKKGIGSSFIDQTTSTTAFGDGADREFVCCVLVLNEKPIPSQWNNLFDLLQEIGIICAFNNVEKEAGNTNVDDIGIDAQQYSFYINIDEAREKTTLLYQKRISKALELLKDKAITLRSSTATDKLDTLHSRCIEVDLDKLAVGK